MQKDFRYFIVTPGRTGSTLLAAILARAGADFGMTGPEYWDRDVGAWEDRFATRAAKNAAQARQIGYWPPPGPRRLLWRWHMMRTKQDLDRALRGARFVKVMPAQYLLQPAIALGYVPRVILSLRDFPSFAASMAYNSALRMHRDLRLEWLDAVRDGMLAIQGFGGCIVDYDELADPAATEWAPRLADATGLVAAEILSARDAMIKPRRDRPTMAIADDECERVYRQIREMFIEAGHQPHLVTTGS